MPLELSDLALIAAVAFFASIIGGTAGYGMGLLLPPILAPIIGPQFVVPVVGLSAIFVNLGRLSAFREGLNLQIVARFLATAMPMTVIGAYFYSLLNGAAVSLLVGGTLLVMVPVRRYLEHRRLRLKETGLSIAGAGYGLLTGGTTGTGVILISILLGTGMGGTGIIATNSAISIVLTATKSAMFWFTGVLPPFALLLAVMIGVVGLPGAYIAKALTKRLPQKVHAAILDATVIVGGISLVWRGIAG